MAIFLMMTLIRVPSYAAGGLVTPVRLWSTAAVIPAVFLGAWLGHRLHVTIGEQTFRRLVAVLLAAIGALLLVRH
ncbi:TSUP family transporter [bacterium]|nr:TSUP family transporter [bacterium]